MKLGLRAVFAALFALGMGAGSAQAADTGCRLVKVAELPVRFNHNQPMIPVTMNGHESWFLVDTGAVETTMWGGAARAMNLHLFTDSNVRFYGVGGVQQATATVVSDFGLGGNKLKDIKFYVIGRTGSAENAGILGRDFFRYFDIEFDLAAKALRLFQPDHCSGHSLAYWTKDPDTVDMIHDDADDEYRVTVMINGKPIAAMIDSGAGTSVITPSAAAFAGIRSEDYAKDVGHAGGIGDDRIETRIASVNAIKLGNEEVKHTKIQVADLYSKTTVMATGSILPQRVEVGNTSMLLGADFLRSHRVLIAPSQKLIYFTYSGGAVFEAVGDPVAPKGVPPTPTPSDK